MPLPDTRGLSLCTPAGLFQAVALCHLLPADSNLIHSRLINLQPISCVPSNPTTQPTGSRGPGCSGGAGLCRVMGGVAV